MKKYRVKVNGKVYEVELEAVETSNEHIEVKKAETVESKETDEAVLAPIGGKVLDIKVSVGQKVKKGDVICIIEAMKMENEVLASTTGVIREIKVSKGSQVANKDPLVIIG